MPVAQQVGCFGTDADQQVALLADAADVEVECACEPLFRNAPFHRLQDHPVFLDDRYPADPAIVGEGLVLGCDEAHDLLHSLGDQDVDPQMSIEQPEAPPGKRVADYDRWFDDSDLCNGCRDLSVLN